MKRANIRSVAWSRAAVIGVLVAGATVLAALVWRVAVSTPFTDELVYERLYGALAAGNFPPLTEVVAAHNGHPYVILKLLISITLLAGLPWVWLMYAQVPLLVLAGAVAAFRGVKAGAPLAALVCAIAVLTPRQWENLYWGMQLAFPLFLLSALAAFVLADRYISANDCRSIWGWLALFAALISLLSNGAGILVLGLACLSVFVARPNWRLRLGAVAVGVAGLALFAASQSLAPRSGVGSHSVDWWLAAEHAVRMIGHQFIDRPPGSLLSLCLGVLGGLFIVVAVARAMKAWRESLFELLCIALGLLLVAGVTYSRVSAGIFQPDAPRYIPLILPLTIGTVLLLARYGQRWIVFAMFTLVALGYLLSLRSEWANGPFRKEALSESHRMLCQTGRIHPLHNMKGFTLSAAALSDVRTLFCKDIPVAERRVDHVNIASTSATGYYREERHTWIGPLFSVSVPTGLRESTATLQGWLPDTKVYPGGKFLIELVVDGVPLKTEEIEAAGAFSVDIALPAGSTVLEVRSPVRPRVGSDQRDLAWVLGSVVFQ